MGKTQQNTKCCNLDNNQTTFTCSLQPHIDVPNPDIEDLPCCGSPPNPRSNSWERPGYKCYQFVDSFMETSIGTVPVVKRKLTFEDKMGALRARIGINRDNYKIAPGVYAVGSPNEKSHVLVTANYKLSFDKLRKNLKSSDVWILVIDTRGINVWCAAGKELFSTEEVTYQVKTNQIDKLVSHKKIILPQLSATGVCAQEVKKSCGFSVIWGPVTTKDIETFIHSGMKATSSMRSVTFPLMERIVLIPVEIALSLKPFAWTVFLIFLFSGMSHSFFSFDMAWSRGFIATYFLLIGIFAGAIVTPIFLPWIPNPYFYIKGTIVGILFSLINIYIFWSKVNFFESIALFIFSTVISSYLAMTFTGSTPYTSPSGVEKEMKSAIPIQIGFMVVSTFLWIGSGFLTK